MVLKIGIFANILFTIFNNLFPIKERDSHPINVIRIFDMAISKPGISYG